MCHLKKKNLEENEILKQIEYWTLKPARPRSSQTVKWNKLERKLLSQSWGSGYQIQLMYLSSKWF